MISSSANSLRAARGRGMAARGCEKPGNPSCPARRAPAADRLIRLLLSAVFLCCSCFPSLLRLFFRGILIFLTLLSEVIIPRDSSFIKAHGSCFALTGVLSIAGRFAKMFGVLNTQTLELFLPPGALGVARLLSDTCAPKPQHPAGAGPMAPNLFRGLGEVPVLTAHRPPARQRCWRR